MRSLPMKINSIDCDFTKTFNKDHFYARESKNDVQNENIYFLIQIK